MTPLVYTINFALCFSSNARIGLNTEEKHINLKQLQAIVFLTSLKESELNE